MKNRYFKQGKITIVALNRIIVIELFSVHDRFNSNNINENKKHLYLLNKCFRY